MGKINFLSLETGMTVSKLFCLQLTPIGDIFLTNQVQC